MKIFGFPKMCFEENEKRDFMPDFFRDIGRFNVKIKLEHNYGDKLGYKPQDYLALNPEIEFVNRTETFHCDVVTIIRTPSNEELKKMHKGSSLFSMIHFVTHKNRCNLLYNLGVNMYAMDSVVDDFNKRLIEFMDGTAENGVAAAVEHFLKINPNSKEIRFLVMGSGLVGKSAVDFAVHSAKIPCVCSVIGTNVTCNQEKVKDLLPNTDILVDATYRKDASKIIISNEMIGLLPENAIVLDLTADDYDINVAPIQVKGIEGIPTGNLDKFVFMPDDEAFEKIPEGIDSRHRRVTVSCYSWPAVNPRKCLAVYQKQMIPFFRVFAENNVQEITTISQDFYNRSLARGDYNFFIGQK
jgi:alanine dehydrogenase